MNTAEPRSLLLVGFAREGQASLRYFSKYSPTTDVYVCDEQKILADLSGVKNHFEGPEYLERAAKRDYDLILRSPGIPPEKVQAFFPNTKVITATGFFLENAPGTLIAVTGTKGKSTTTSLIAHIFAADRNDVRLVGNIGKPALDFLVDADAETVFVCELSSFQLEDSTRSPQTAVLLPIVPEHLDHHGSFEKYCKAKATIFLFQKPSDFLVVDPRNVALSHRASHGTVVDVHKRCRWEGTTLLVDGESMGFSSHQLQLFGKGACDNVCYAVVTALLHNISLNKILKALETFEPLPHRLEIVATKKNVTYINDSLCTVPEAMINALESFPERVSVLIAGGHDRGVPYEILGAALARANLTLLLLFHGAGERIAAVATLAGVSCPVLFVESMQQAVTLAQQYAPSGTTVLLSPAASSFGIFKDYADRGDQFRKAVEQLEQ